MIFPMSHWSTLGGVDIFVSDDPSPVAANRIGFRLRDAVRRRGSAALALSGGSTAPPMIAALLDADVPWDRVGVWQVDERVAPDGDDTRNAAQLDALSQRCAVHLMPVTANDLRAAARRYAAGLPARFDLVHLGVGDDGHTASWPPGRPEIAHSDRLVELVDEFHGQPRMTVTKTIVDSARSRLVLARGASKRPVIERWLLGDADLPISWVRRTATSIYLDGAAAPRAPLQ
jgi:6-phosphogluconolactonase/glucosamine-6-phosphate isomerase/deaminase